MKKSGIYKITTLHNNKVYIGSSKNVYKRKTQHFTSLKSGTHYNRYLQRVYNKYGKNNFKVEYLELNIPYEQLWIKENEYILKYDSINKGYNATIPLKDERLSLPSEIIEQKRRAAYKQFYGQTTEAEYQRWKDLKQNPIKKDLTNHTNCTPIVGKDKLGNITMFKSVAEAARKLKVYQESIRKVLRGQNKTCKGLSFVKI